MITDSAIEPSPIVVSPFKKPCNNQIPHEKEKFNNQLSKVRVKAEDTIGILKGRFPWLRSIRNKLDEDSKSMTRILKLIDCCIILHNLLVNYDQDFDMD